MEAATKALGSMSLLAKRLGVSKARAYEMARLGLLPGVVRLGRQVRVDMDKLEAWIDNGGQALPGGWKRQAD